MLTLLAVAAIATIATLSNPVAASPILQITSPSEALSYVPSATASVVGTVQPANSSLSLNGGPDLSDGSGSFIATLNLSEGPNNFSLEATDWTGARSWYNFTVVRDSFPPNLTVDAPSDRLLTNNTTIEVRGHTEAGANLTVNGFPVAVDPADGAFSHNITLDALFDKTENLIVIRSRDLAGNVAYSNRSVIVDITAPSLDFDFDIALAYRIQHGEPLSVATLDVRGTTDSPDATIEIAGQRVELTGYAFSRTILLSEGLNIIPIRAWDDAGNLRVVELPVLRDTRAPTLVVTSPPSETVFLSTTVLTIKGTVDGAPLAWVRVVHRNATGQPLADQVTATSSNATGYAFIYNLTLLTDGVPHAARVEASDTAGNVANFFFNYTSDISAPALTVSPVPPTLTSPKVWVNGTTYAGVSSVSINGQPFPVTAGTFSVEWPLENREGPQTIVVKVTNDAGEETQQILTVSVTFPAVPTQATLLVEGGPVPASVPPDTPTLLQLDVALGSDLMVNWFVDGRPVGSGPSVEVTLEAGAHTVEAVVSNGVHEETFSFTVTAGAASQSTQPSGGALPAELALALLVIAAAALAAVLVLRAKRRR